MAHDFQADIDAIGRIPAVPTILDVVCRTTGMGFAAVARVTEDRWIACNIKDDIAFGLQAGGELKIETTICHEIRQHREPVVIDHVAKDEVYCRHHTPALYGFQSYISMPILLPDGTFFGTLCAIDPKPRALKTPEVIGMFKLFAELIAFHLNAIQRLDTSEANLARERQIADFRDQFIAVLGHDLRNPLMAFKAGLRLVETRPGQAKEIIGEMQRSISRMAGLVDNMLDLARGRLGGGMNLKREVDRSLEDTLSQVIEELRRTSTKSVLDVAFALREPVYCDHARIAQLLSNLLGNAITHGAPDTPIIIRAAAQDGTFELSVSNGGNPIPPAALQCLFQPFFRVSAQGSQEGLGLGLYIASEIARAHGGVLDVSSNDKETCFTFRMPYRASSGL